MVYVLLVDGFEEVEAIEPIDIMRRCGIDVKTVGVNSKFVKGSHNITIEADIEIDMVLRDEMDMLVLPGGPGHTLLERSTLAMELLKYAVENGKYVGAICAAPSILGKFGYLKGKRATCFPGYETELDGAEFTGEKTVVDGKFITGKGAGAAAEFGFALAEILAGRAMKSKIKKSMQY